MGRLTQVRRKMPASRVISLSIVSFEWGLNIRGYGGLQFLFKVE
jgi:hypothetical protein